MFMNSVGCIDMQRRTVLTGAASGLAATAGCLTGTPKDEESPANRTPTNTTEDPVDEDALTNCDACSATAPPQPTSGEGLPDSRSYPQGPPAFTEDAVTEFLKQYERAFKYNAMLADFVADEQCLRYLELYVVDSETTVRETDQGYEAEVTTQGSYTGTTCPGESGTATATGVPHVDLAKMPAQYCVTRRALTREETVYQCW